MMPQQMYGSRDYQIFVENTQVFNIKKQPPEVFCKKVFLKISQNSQENTCAKASFLIMLKAGSDIIVFL